MPRAFIGIGSNIDPESNIRAALRRLAAAVRLQAVSTFYREPALDRPQEPDFYNGVVAIDTDLPPAALKWQVLRPIEAALGRRRGADKYAARTIDLDLLLYDDCALCGADLTLPDPSICARAFVALPLLELSPELALPGSGVSIREIARRFVAAELQALPDYTRRLRREFLSLRHA